MSFGRRPGGKKEVIGFRLAARESAAEREKVRTDLYRRRAKAPSTPANSAQIFISIVPVASPAPSLEERIRVTSNIGGVRNLKAHGFNRRIDVWR